VSRRCIPALLACKARLRRKISILCFYLLFSSTYLRHSQMCNLYSQRELGWLFLWTLFALQMLDGRVLTMLACLLACCIEPKKCYAMFLVVRGMVWYGICFFSRSCFGLVTVTILFATSILATFSHTRQLCSTPVVPVAESIE
jgi:hypothetical protein